MPRRLRMAALAAMLVLASGIAVAFTAPPTTLAATTICDQYGSTTVGSYIVQNNRWGTSSTQCISVTSSGFSIIQQDGTGNLSGAPTAYPSIYLGCHYSNCSPGSPLPMQISAIRTATSSISVSYPGSGTYDAAYDIWLNDTTSVSGVQKTEIMIWMNHTGSIQPVGSNSGSTVAIAGHSWNVWTGNNGSNNVVSYVGNPAGMTSLSFSVMDFIHDTLGRGSAYGNSSWYLTSIQAGFEPWIGGVGLSVNSFSASVTGGGPVGTPPSTPRASSTPVRTSSPTPTIAPTATASGTTTARCSAAIVESGWNNGFTAAVTVTNTGTVATKGWKVTWTWPGNQVIVNTWNATVTQSGTAVTATNLGYNGVIGVGGNATFGLQASFSGTNAVPTLTCTAS